MNIMANRINLNGTSYHGAGAIAEIANEAKARGYKKAFVCSDPDLIKFQVTSKVTDILEQNGLAYEIYSDIKANPTIQNVQNGVAAFKKSEADYIIAIGGGVSRAGDIILDGLEDEIRSHILYKEEEFSPIVIATLGNDAGIIGAAFLN